MLSSELVDVLHDKNMIIHWFKKVEYHFDFHHFLTLVPILTFYYKRERLKTGSSLVFHILRMITTVFTYRGTMITALEALYMVFQMVMAVDYCTPYIVNVFHFCHQTSNNYSTLTSPTTLQLCKNNKILCTKCKIVPY